MSTLKLTTPETIDNMPVMPRHKLTALRDTRSFKKGDFEECFIGKMSDGRYMVMSANFLNTTKHYEVFTESELHQSFSEDVSPLNVVI